VGYNSVLRAALRPRPHYLYKSAAENSANREPNPSFYLLPTRPRAFAFRCARPFRFPHPPRFAFTVCDLFALARTSRRSFFPCAFCSPFRRLENGLTRNYLLAKFLREREKLPRTSEHVKMYTYAYRCRLSGHRTVTYGDFKRLFADSPSPRVSRYIVLLLFDAPLDRSQTRHEETSLAVGWIA